MNLINYTKVQKGDLIILVPQEARNEEGVLSSLRPCLWSHKNLGYKIFGKLHIGLLIELYLRENPHVQAKETTIDFTNRNNYSDGLEAVLLNLHQTKCMAVVHKYLSTVSEKYDNKYANFCVDSHWHNGSRYLISIIPVENFQLNETVALHLQASSYSSFDLPFYEDVITSMLRCEKNDTELPLDLNTLPFNEIIPIPVLDKRLIIEENNSALIIENNRYYVALSSTKHKIVIPLDWKTLVAYTFDEMKVVDYTKVCLKLERFSELFNKSCNYESYFKGLAELLDSENFGIYPWEEFLKKYPDLSMIYIDHEYGKYFRHFGLIHGLDKDGKTLFKRRRLMKMRSNHKITNGKHIVTNLA